MTIRGKLFETGVACEDTDSVGLRVRACLLIISARYLYQRRAFSEPCKLLTVRVADSGGEACNATSVEASERPKSSSTMVYARYQSPESVGIASLSTEDLQR